MTLIYTVPLFINGQERVAQSTFEVKSPTTGKTIHRCSSASLSDVQDVANAAEKAFASWRKLPPAKRRDLFLKTAEIVNARREELSGYMIDETSCSRHWADFNLSSAVEILKDTAGRIATIEGSVVATMDENVKAMVVKEPYGVVLGIAPWNSPYVLGIRAVTYPLAVGNCAILKGSELSPRVMWGIISCFHEAGLPPGVVSLILHAPHDAPAITSALIAHPAIKKVNFTGSTSIGRVIAKLAADHLKPALLELGGKAPAIVWDDADLPRAAAQCVLGAFLNNGQICMSTERIIVQHEIYSRFKEELVRVMGNQLPHGSGPTILITEAAMSKTRKLILNALEKGASIVAGKPPSNVATDTTISPVIIEGVSPEMDLNATESFGPVVSLFKVKNEEEALQLANDTEYGLSSAVFTSDLSRAVRLAEGIETGAVHINSMTVHDEPGIPHGGAKASGYGRFNSTTGLDEWTRSKTLTFTV